MGSFDAIASAVSGMQAQAFALQNISGNIANSQTTAYKTTDTSFQDLLTAQMSGMPSSDGAQALSTSSDTTQGTIQTTTVATDMAINGDGYFTVEQASGVDGNGQPSFTGSTPVYTRRGDFQLDANGFLVNGAGDYLMGTPDAAATGAAAAGTPQVLQFDTATLPTGQGTLESVSVGSNNVLQGTFSGGNTVGIAGIPLSTFNGQGFLTQGDGETFTPTVLSGAALQGASGTVEIGRAHV